MAERLVYTEDVAGSSPVPSTPHYPNGRGRRLKIATVSVRIRREARKYKTTTRKAIMIHFASESGDIVAGDVLVCEHGDHPPLIQVSLSAAPFNFLAGSFLMGAKAFMEQHLELCKLEGATEEDLELRRTVLNHMILALGTTFTCGL